MADRVSVPTLVMTGGPLDGTSYPLPLTGGEAIVGSSMDAGVQIMLGNVEPFHARVVLTPAGLAIEDAGSATGTFVNGEKVEARHALQDGDRVCLGPPGAKGSAKLLVLLPGAAGEASPALAHDDARAVSRRAAGGPLLRGGAGPGVLRRRRSPRRRRSSTCRPRRSSTRRRSSSRVTSPGRRSRPPRSPPPRTKATRSSPPRCRPPRTASRPGPPRRPRRRRSRLRHLRRLPRASPPPRGPPPPTARPAAARTGEADRPSSSGSAARARPHGSAEAGVPDGAALDPGGAPVRACRSIRVPAAAARTRAGGPRQREGQGPPDGEAPPVLLALAATGADPPDPGRDRGSRRGRGARVVLLHPRDAARGGLDHALTRRSGTEPSPSRESTSPGRRRGNTVLFGAATGQVTKASDTVLEVVVPRRGEGPGAGRGADEGRPLEARHPHGPGNGAGHRARARRGHAGTGRAREGRGVRGPEAHRPGRGGRGHRRRGEPPRACG